MNLKYLRTTLIFIFTTMEFLRYRKIPNLNVWHCNSWFLNGNIHRESKTDIERYGSRIYLPKTKSKLCPLTLLRKYMKLAQIDAQIKVYVKGVRAFV